MARRRVFRRADRAATIRALADAATTAGDFARPGHIFPLRSRKGGVLVRAGHTEASVDLCRLAGMKPVGVLCEVMNDDGTMARRPRARGVCQAAQPQDRHDCRPHPLSVAQRALGRARCRAERTDGFWRIPALRVRGSRAVRMCIWRWHVGASMVRMRLSCVCTLPTRCAISWVFVECNALGPCAPLCNASRTLATVLS